MTCLAQSKDGCQANMLRFRPLNFLNKEWDELFSKDRGFLSSKNTIDLGWEVVPDIGGLDHLNKLLHQLLGWVSDVANGVGHNLHKDGDRKRTLLDLLDNEHGGWVGSNNRKNVIEDLLHSLHASGP